MTAASPAHATATRGRAVTAVRVALPVLAIWLAAGAALSRATGRVTDWFVMSDELYYERLAIAVAHGGSPLPRLHGVRVPNLDQLYPLLIAPFYHGDTLVPEALHQVHVFDAFVFTSAIVPVFLLARTVTGRTGLSLGVALLSVAVPWAVYSSLLLTEVVAYPAFAWAILGLQRALEAPGARRDLLALAGIALATFARTQFLVLLVVLPVALVAQALAERRLREALRRHRVLVAAYGLLAAGAAALAASGGLARVLGTYRAAGEGDLLPPGLAGSLLEHVAALALAVALLPFLVGTGWALARLARPRAGAAAFAALALATIAGIVLEVASFDLRYTGADVSDRYLYYLVPVVLVAAAAAISDPPWPRAALVVPTAIVAAGCAMLSLPHYQKLNMDRPLALAYEWIVDLAGSVGAARVLLVVATLVLAALYLEGSLLLPRPVLAGLVAALAVAALPSLAAASFLRFLGQPGTSGRPVTLDQGVVFDWIDRAVGPASRVTMVPFPIVPGDYWAGTAYWWDVEFWNASVVRDVIRGPSFYATSSTFPKLDLRFDPATGRASRSPTPWAVQALRETRYRIAGTRTLQERNLYLIQAEQPWRAEWLSRGLYDDGWTKPGTPARIRVFARPADRHGITRQLTLQLRAPGEVPPRAYRLRSPGQDVRGTVGADTKTVPLTLCVPAGGHVDVRLDVDGHSPVYGDPTNSVTFGQAREAGVQLAEIALADETGGACDPG
ncbi:MAG TPA: hypothetical protein VFI37_01575 [Gaiellaceae bacterium]|nr:hypothetical protein [Gaiellaceae bacterium]